jgi:hypothetical protein
MRTITSLSLYVLNIKQQWVNRKKKQFRYTIDICVDYLDSDLGFIIQKKNKGGNLWEFIIVLYYRNKQVKLSVIVNLQKDFIFFSFSLNFIRTNWMSIASTWDSLHIRHIESYHEDIKVLD